MGNTLNFFILCHFPSQLLETESRIIYSVCVYAVIISKYATKVVGTQKDKYLVSMERKIKSSRLSTHLSQLNSEELKPMNFGLMYFATLQNHKETAINSIQLWFSNIHCS